MTNLLHPLDLATNLELNNDGLWLGHTQPAYGNMVGPFGGVTSAVMLNAVLKHQNRLGDPVSLTVNFAGPIEDGALHHPSPSPENQSLDTALVHDTFSA